MVSIGALSERGVAVAVETELAIEVCKQKRMELINVVNDSVGHLSESIIMITYSKPNVCWKYCWGLENPNRLLY